VLPSYRNGEAHLFLSAELPQRPIKELALPGTLPCVSELDAIVEKSLRSFYRDICSEWCGRENEAVNLYALGHLAKHVVPGTVLSDLTQIGIEVAVRQLPKCDEHPGRRDTVRKDLVIWPTAGMTLWKTNLPHNEPSAIMEWKVNHYFSRAAHGQNRQEHLQDIQWLHETSLRLAGSDFVGYAVLLENLQSPRVLTCVRIHAGVEQQFLTVTGPEDSALPT
jgi:hypothetical protein